MSVCLSVCLSVVCVCVYVCLIDCVDLGFFVCLFVVVVCFERGEGGRKRESERETPTAATETSSRVSAL